MQGVVLKKNKKKILKENDDEIKKDFVFDY